MNRSDLLKKIEKLNDAVIILNDANFKFGRDNTKENVELWDQANHNYNLVLVELYDCVSELISD